MGWVGVGVVKGPGEKTFVECLILEENTEAGSWLQGLS